jgi:hypothetical protein
MLPFKLLFALNMKSWKIRIYKTLHPPDLENRPRGLLLRRTTIHDHQHLGGVPGYFASARWGEDLIESFIEEISIRWNCDGVKVSINIWIHQLEIVIQVELQSHFISNISVNPQFKLWMLPNNIHSPSPKPDGGSDSRRNWRGSGGD